MPSARPVRAAALVEEPEEVDTPEPDRWAEWLRSRRDAGNPALRQQMLLQLASVRDRVLANAEITAGNRVLDVGCGEGLIGFGAVDLVGSNGVVVFSDISGELIEFCRSAAVERGIVERCEFLRTGLPGLEGVADQSVDAVTVRSVLSYVADKQAAMANMYRVLRPGGRLALFEPINRFCWPGPEDQLWGCDVTGLEQLARQVKDTYRRHAPETATMIDFDERDLLHWAQQGGFTRLRLDYQVEISNQAYSVPSFEVFLDMAPNPLAPTYRDMLSQALGEPSRTELLDRLRAQCDSGAWRRRSAVVHLAATRL